MGRVPRGGCAIVIALRCPLVSRCAGGDRRGTFSGRRLTSGELGDLRSPSFMRRFAKSDRTEGEAGELCWSLPRGGRVACRDGPPPGLWTADAVIAGERHAAADRGARVRVSQPSTPTPLGFSRCGVLGSADFCNTFFGGKGEKLCTTNAVLTDPCWRWARLGKTRRCKPEFRHRGAGLNLVRVAGD
jgi:hypothetical protein